MATSSAQLFWISVGRQADNTSLRSRGIRTLPSLGRRLWAVTLNSRIMALEGCLGSEVLLVRSSKASSA